MMPRRPTHRHLLTLGALLALAGCQSAPVRSARVSSRSELDNFSLEIPLPGDTGVCARRPAPTGVGTLLMLYLPDREHAVAVSSVMVDSTGQVVGFSDRRGMVAFHGIPGGTRAQFDSALAEARRTTRSSTMTLTFATGQALLMNEGGGRPDRSVVVLISDVANNPRFDRPLARIEEIRSRCGEGPAARPMFEFQVQKPAAYMGGTSISPHPSGSGSTVVQFVVDSTGAIRTSTFKVLRFTDSALIDDAKRVLAQWRYLPAEIDGRKVSQLVQTAIER